MPINLRKLTLSVEAACAVSVWGDLQYFVTTGSVANGKQTELQGF